MGNNYQYQNDETDIRDISLIKPSEDPENSGVIESASDLINHLKKREDIVIVGSAYFNKILNGKQEIPKEWAKKEILLPDTIQEIKGEIHIKSYLFGEPGTKPKPSGMALSHQIFDIHCVAVVPKSS